MNELEDDIVENREIPLDTPTIQDAGQTSITPSQPPDGGYGWVVVIAGTLNMVITLGQLRILAFISAEIIDIFQKSAVEVGAIASLCLALRMFFGPVAGGLSQKYGLRKIAIVGSIINAVGMILSSFPLSLPYLYFTLGILCGVGESFITTTSFVVPTVYFTKRRARAVGLVTLGASIGMLVYPVITVKLLENYGYTGTMLILSAINLNHIPMCALYRPLQYQSKISKAKDCLRSSKRNGPINDAKLIDLSANETSKNLNLEYESVPVVHSLSLRIRLNQIAERLGVTLLWNVLFMALFFFVFTMHLYASIVFTFISKYAMDIGVSPIQTSLIITMSGICDGLSRALSGFLYDWKHVKRNRIFLHAVQGVLLGVCVMLMAAFANGFISLTILYLLIAFLWGVFAAQLITVVHDMIGNQAAKGIGMVLFAMGIGFVLGPLIAGAVRETMGAYWVAFLVAGGVQTVGGGIYAVVYVFRKNKDVNREDTPIVVTTVNTEGECA